MFYSQILYNTFLMKIYFRHLMKNFIMFNPSEEQK